MSTADKLRSAKALIEYPKRWCQRAYRSNGARCARGALFSVRASNEAHGFLNLAAFEIGQNSVERVNDATDHPTVMKMFDRAIELAEREERGE